MSYPFLDQKAESGFLEPNASALPLESVTVLIIDDHALVRSAISQVLIPHSEFKEVVTVQNYAEAELQAATLYPDIIWLDMHITHCDGISEISRLRKLSPDSRIMALADVEDEQEAFAAVMAGAQGYRSKQDVDPGEIAAMVHMLYRGEIVLRPVLLTRLVHRLRAAAMPLWGSESGSSCRILQRNGDFDGLAQLTAREREVLQLISKGYRDRDIAEGLHIAEKTVQKHVQSVLSKLGAQNRTEAAYLIHHHEALWAT